MKYQTIERLAIIGLFVALTLMPAYGQFQSELVIEIPFSFTAGEKTLPAGRYSLRPANQIGLRSNLLLSNRTAGKSIMVTTNLIQKKVIETRMRVLFNRYGDQYFLSEVHMPGTDFARALPKGDVEVKLASSGAEHKIVALVSR